MPKTSENKEQSFISKLFPRIKSLLFKAKPSKTLDSREVEKILDDDILEEEKALHNINNFYKGTVEDAMVPRSDIVAVKSDIALEALSRVMIEEGHTRVLVYKDLLDTVIGFVHIKDLFTIVAQSKKFSLKSVMRKPIFTTHAMKLTDLLTEMKKKRTHIAVVVDEYGGTDGLVTIEDVMEQIVGEIEDEHDDELNREGFKVLNPHTVLCSARIEVEELEEIIGVSLKKPEDEFDTIGGLVLDKVGNFPKKGDIIDITPEVKIEVVDATPRSIHQLKIILNDPAKLPEGDKS